MANSQLNSHQADILLDSEPNPICAGTLISSYLVLTVFSCLKGKDDTKIKVRAPSGDSSSQQIRNVEIIHSYPALKSNSSENDIAVILLDSDFQLGESLKVLDMIKDNSNETEEYFSLSLSSSSSSCGNIKLVRTGHSDCNRATDSPNSICVKPSQPSSCSLPLPVIGSGLICKFHGSSFLCGALAGNSTSFIAYTDISKYFYWIGLTFGTRPGEDEQEDDSAGLGPAIFKGHEVSSSGVSTSIPYQLSLQERRRGVWHHICGAVIIDEKTALTAAHCFGNNCGLSSYRVVAGVTKLDSTSTTKQTLQLQKIIRHPDYKIKKWWRGNDIAIIHVEGSFVFNENVGNIWISPPHGTNSTDFRGRVSGWGKTSNNGGASNSLQEVDIEIWSDSECNNVWPTLFKSSMICSYDNVSNICGGDSGGPLVVQNYQFNQKTTRDLLVGIASFSSTDCEKPEEPNGFTEVSHFLSWIKENRASKCEATEFQCFNGGCIDECSLCDGADECGDGSAEKQCEEEMDVEKMKRCLRKNQQQLKSIIHSQNQTINKLEEQLKNLNLNLSENPVFPAAGFSTTRTKSNDSSLTFSGDLYQVVTQTEPDDSEYENQSDSPDEESPTALPPCQCPTQSNNFSNSGKPTGDPFSKFSARLYQAVKENQSENFVLSALSARNALVMLSLGAAGETAEEFQKVLQLPADPREIINRQSNLISSLNNISSPSLGLRFVTGDAIFVASKIRLQRQFKDHVAGLRGEIDRTDFGSTEFTAKKINAWAQSKTEGKIVKIVEPSDLNDQISLLVLNTIYFKGSWENKFNVSKTRQRPFLINSSCSVNVDMMTQTNEFHLADLEEPKAKVILLPYKGERLSMIIYLPHKSGNDEGALDTLENWLKNESPFDIQKELFQEKKLSNVSVSLPKFKIWSSLKLKEPLKTLGLGKMFDEDTANFSGIFNDPRNFPVSQVLQETLIEVDEEGTEAAAATGIQLVATSFSPAPQFTADRPFLFQILDSTTKTILFMGRVKNPLDSGSAESTASAGQTNEPTCLNPHPTESSNTNTNTNTRNNIRPTQAEPNNSCEGNSLSPAAAWGSYYHIGRHWKYSSTTNGPCFPFDWKVQQVIIDMRSCVAFYQDKNCTQEEFRMDTTKASRGQDAKLPYDLVKSSKSIGVCSSF